MKIVNENEKESLQIQDAPPSLGRLFDCRIEGRESFDATVSATCWDHHLRRSRRGRFYNSIGKQQYFKLTNQGVESLFSHKSFAQSIVTKAVKDACRLDCGLSPAALSPQAGKAVPQRGR